MREFDNNGFGKNEKPSWNGQGEYVPFISDGGGGGGGGTYTPPVAPNPTFVPTRQYFVRFSYYY